MTMKDIGANKTDINDAIAFTANQVRREKIRVFMDKLIFKDILPPQQARVYCEVIRGTELRGAILVTRELTPQDDAFIGALIMGAV